MITTIRLKGVEGISRVPCQSNPSTIIETCNGCGDIELVRMRGTLSHVERPLQVDMFNSVCSAVIYQGRIANMIYS